jgi:hypothetical protein
MAQFINGCKLKSQNFYKSEPNLVFNLDNKNKLISNNKENYTDVLDYKNYINQQRELLERIYHQQKKLKQFHFETDYLTSYNATSTIESNVNNNKNNLFSQCSSPIIISPQSKTNSANKNNIYSNNSNINENRNEVLLNKQNIMSISLNNNNKHFHKSKTCKKPVSSLLPSNDTSFNLQFQNKSALNKPKPNDSVNMNSCSKSKINSQFV